MDVVFRLFSLIFTERRNQWWKKADCLGRLLRILDEIGYWKELNYFGVDGAKRIETIKSLDSFLKKTETWKENPYLLRSEKGEHGVFVGITIRRPGLNFYLRVNGSALTKRRDRILNEFVILGCRLHEEFEQKAHFGPDFQVTLLSPDYPRPRPPHAHPLWPVGSIIDFVSKPYRRHNPGDRPDALQKLLSNPVPKGVRRQDRNNLIVFRWVDDLLDEERVSTARSNQETWFAKVLNYPIPPSYNSFGDFLETPMVMEPHAPLTFYDTQFKEGYKGLVRNPDGQIDPSILSEMSDWLRNKALPDGTVLEHLHVIFPNRDSAVYFLNQAMDMGIQKVIYTDSKGSLWNINPPGLWLDSEQSLLKG